MSSQNPRRPTALPAGGTLGIISPSSPVDPSRLQTGIGWLQNRGFRTVLGRHALDRDGHLAGTDQDRAADLQEMYADPTVDAVLCARGGSSSMRLWRRIDWDSLRALPPKIFCGYSDITSLHIPFLQRLNVITFHAPTVWELGARASDSAGEWMLHLLQSKVPLDEVPGRAAHTLIGGAAEGRLCGGCLTLIRATLATPYQIDTTGSLLILEDIDNAPWMIERDLLQLAEAGLLEKAAGFIVGEATNADDTDTQPMRRIWQEMLAPFGKPCVLGFPVGHVCDNLALPLGALARLDADRGTVTLLEPAVA
ncbi:MAG TPA: LD-carboxypeptidase [Capsulimonadaceae bacterium]|nr:LD-carboxypeptidase [Capsulimonadaceae bacterium]